MNIGKRLIHLAILMVAAGIFAQSIAPGHACALSEEKLPEGTRREIKDGVIYENWPLDQLLTELSRKAGLRYTHNPGIKGAKYLVTGTIAHIAGPEQAEQQLREIAFYYGIEIAKRKQNVYALTQEDLAAIPHEKFMWKIRYIAEADMPAIITKLEALQTTVESKIDYSDTRVLTIRGRADEVHRVIRLLDQLDSEAGLGASENEEGDTFAVPKQALVDRSQDKPSSVFLSDELLAAFDEPRLDNGTGKNPSAIRIIINRSVRSPIMFKWLPPEGVGASTLITKTVQRHRNEEGKDSYRPQFEQTIELPEASTRLLQSTYSQSPITDRPQSIRHEETTDGSMWIYEVAAPEASTLIVRHNPDDLEVSSQVTPKKDLIIEQRLTMFTMMLWTLSGIDELPY